MQDTTEKFEELSAWWRYGVILVVIFGFAVLAWVSVRSYSDAPPIPGRVATLSGDIVFTRDDIVAGQQVFLRYGLMENGTMWGHGAYLGPDFSAEYLHTLALDATMTVARRTYGKDLRLLTTEQRAAVTTAVQRMLKENRYSPKTDILTFTAEEAGSYHHQIEKWKAYFSDTR